MLSAGFIYSHEAEIQQCTHMLLGLECAPEATRAALALCKKHHIFTILNPAPAIPLDLDFLKAFDLITPNLQEATVLLGLTRQPAPKDLAAYFIKAGLSQTIVTLGNHGSLLLTSEKALLFPARKVTAIDTTCAGDTFNAALAVALGTGKSLKEAVIYAANAAAWSVCHAHVMEALPTSKDLDGFCMPIDPLPILIS